VISRRSACRAWCGPEVFAFLYQTMRRQPTRCLVGRGFILKGMRYALLEGHCTALLSHLLEGSLCPSVSRSLLAASGDGVLHERAPASAADRLGRSLHGSSGKEGDARGCPDLRRRGEALPVLGL